MTGEHKQREAQTGYEKRDATAGPILRAGIALSALVGASLLISYWLDRGLTPEAPEVDQYALRVRKVAEMTWPELQAHPYGEIEEHQKIEARRLNHYEWIDRQNGVARIPIERAMQLFLIHNKKPVEGAK